MLKHKSFWILVLGLFFCSAVYIAYFSDSKSRSTCSDRPIVTVWPNFVEESPDSELQVLGNFLAENLLDCIAAIDGICAVAGYDGHWDNAQDYATDLGASHYIQGSVESTEGQINVSLRLYHSDVVTWAPHFTFDRASRGGERKEPFDLALEVAETLCKSTVQHLN